MSEVVAGSERPPEALHAHGSAPSTRVAAPTTTHAASQPVPSAEDHRVANRPADPMPAHAHYTEGHAALPPGMKDALDNMRAAAEAAVLVSSMHQTGDRQGRWRFLNTLDRVDDPGVRKKLKEQFAAQTGKDLDSFVQTTNWHSKRDAEQAHDLLSDERGRAEEKLAAKSPAEQQQLRVKSIKWAEQVLAVTRKDDIDDDKSAKAIFDTLGPRSPEEIEMIRAEIRRQTGGRSAYQELDTSLSGGTEDEALAGLKGNHVHAVIAGVKNADGDATRVKELLRSLSPAEVEQLKRTDPTAAVWMSMSVAGSQREEIAQLVQGHRAEADGARIADLLKEPEDGLQMDGMFVSKQSQQNLEHRKTANVIDELRSMKPAEIQAARAAWDQAHPEQSFDTMVQRRFGDGDRDTLLRIQALTSGHKVEERALALREAMRTQNQGEIEKALANPDLASDDPMKRSIAIAEKAELEVRMRDLDAQRRKAEALLAGADPTQVEGAALKDQLAHYYMRYGDTLPEPKSLDDMLDLANKDKVLERRAKEADRNVYATMELADDGKLSKVTEIQRATDKEQKAQLLEGLSSNAERDKTAAEFKARYGTDMIGNPHAAEIEQTARYLKQLGDDRPLSAIQAEVEKELVSGTEKRIENVATHGVVAERDAATQLALQRDIFERQHSDSLEGSERMRELMGGNAGTEDLARHQLANLDSMLTPASANPYDMTPRQLMDPADASTFNAYSSALTTTLEVQKAEKMKHAERIATAFSTIAKIGALLVGQPHLVFLIDMAAGLTEIAIKQSAGGADYDSTADFKLLGVTALVDTLTMGASKAGLLGKVDDLAKVEGTVAKTADDIVEQGATSAARSEIVEDGVKQVAASEARLGSKLTGAADDAASSTAATATANLEKAATAETAEAAAKSSAAVALATNMGINTVGVVGYGMVDGQNADDMLIGVARGLVGSWLPGKLGAKAQDAIGDATAAQRLLGKVASGGANILGDAAISGNSLQDSALGYGGNKFHEHQAHKAAHHADHPHLPTDEHASRRLPASAEAHLAAHGHFAEDHGTHHPSSGGIEDRGGNGARYARKISPGGTGQAFAGHGSLRRNAGMYTMPEGTTLTMWVGDGKKLPDHLGRLIEAGDHDAFWRLPGFGWLSDESVNTTVSA